MKLIRKLFVLAIWTILFTLVGCVGNRAEAPLSNSEGEYVDDESAEVPPMTYSPATNTPEDTPEDASEDIPEDMPADTLDDASPVGILRLGDSFMYQTINVTLGEAIIFVSYARTFDVNLTRGTFPIFGEDFEKVLYIPVTLIDTEDDLLLIGQYQWMLMDSTLYYSQDRVNHSPGLWRNPGGDGISELFPWNGQYEPFAKTHIRLAYTGDGEYLLRFVLRENGWNSPIKKTFELPLDIIWPETPTLITVAIIERQPDERVIIGNFDVAVGEVAVDTEIIGIGGDPDGGWGVTLFPVSATNIGNTYEHLSALAPYRLNSNACFPPPITRIAYNGVAMPLSEAPAIPPGASVQFYLPIDAFVCENTAIFRPFRFTETSIDEAGNITITHNLYEFCLPWCSWCDGCGE